MADGDVGCCCNVINNVFIHYFSIFLTSSHRLADTGLECIILVCRKSAVGLPTVGVPYVNSKQPPSSCFLEKTNYFKLDRRPKTNNQQQPQRTRYLPITHHHNMATLMNIMFHSHPFINTTFMQWTALLASCEQADSKSYYDLF